MAADKNVNKVIVNGEVILDLTGDTVTADKLTEGYTAHDASGAVITGTMTAGSGGDTNPVAESKAVNFIDYDGTIRYSYTVEEAAALTELPALPTHEGLVCQGWNWTLADIKTVVGRGVVVGATYVTDDGKTRLYIKIDQTERRTVPLHFTQSVANGVTVDWGDGSETETSSVVDADVNLAHTYAYACAVGEHIITLQVNSDNVAVTLGCNYDDGLEQTELNVFGSVPVYKAMLRKIEFGDNCRANNSAFWGCCNLEAISRVPFVAIVGNSAMTATVGGKLFQDCTKLKCAIINPLPYIGLFSTSIKCAIQSFAFSGTGCTVISIPNASTINGSAFANVSCSTVFIPDGTTTVLGTISGSNLTTLFFPSSVTSLST